MGSRARGDGEHLLGHGHLEIQRFRDFSLEARDIGVANMPAILAQMRGDAIRTRLNREKGRAHGIRPRTAARVPHRGDVIDIHPKAEFRAHPAFAP